MSDYPGQSKRSYAIFTALGVATTTPGPPPSVTVYLPDGRVVTRYGTLVDPPTPVVTVTFPDGTTSTPTPVRDSTGLWHADYVIPNPEQGGERVVRWQTTGGSPAQNSASERIFPVQNFAT